MTPLQTDQAGTPWALRLRLAPALWRPAFLVPYEAASFDTAQFAAASLACPAEIARSVPVRQAEFFHGRLAARLALAALGCTDVQVGVGPGRAPVWPRGVAGSISHTHRVALAIAVDVPEHAPGGLGLDIEHPVAADQQAEIAQVVLDEAERSLLDAAAAEHGSGLALALAFSAKEAYYKAVHALVRRVLDFDAVRLAAIDWRERKVRLTAVASAGAPLAAGQTCDVYFDMPAPDLVVTSFAWGHASVSGPCTPGAGDGLA